jgi:hypothetical protein
MANDLAPFSDGDPPVMVKKLLLALVVLFLGFWLFTDPHGLAHATKTSAGQTWDLSSQMFTALIKFFHAL